MFPHVRKPSTPIPSCPVISDFNTGQAAADELRVRHPHTQVSGSGDVMRACPAELKAMFEQKSDPMQTCVR